MARIRSIKPSFWESGSNSKLSIPARLLFIGLWNEADDEGRLIGSTKNLAGSLFPHDDDVTARKLDKWLDELCALGKVVRYEVDGIKYLWLPKFTTHQRISHATPSVLPIPPGCAQDGFANGSGEAPDSFSLEGKGKEGIPEGEGNPTLCPEPFVVDDAMRRWGALKAPAVDLDKLADEMTAWSRSKGRRRVSWKKTLESWALKRQGESGAKAARFDDVDAMSRGRG